MAAALEQARLGLAAGEVPIGAVAVVGGEIVARAFNQPIGSSDPTAHAEVLVLRAAAQQAGNYRLGDASVYVTVEPCLMCVGALLQSDVEALVYALPNAEDGAAGTVLQLAQHPALARRLRVVSGIRRDEAEELFATAGAGVSG